MKKLQILLLSLLVACGSAEPERHTATVDVDMSSLTAMLEAMNAVTDNHIDIGALAQMTASVPMDDEKQADLSVSIDGTDEALFFHVWREQPDWVHIYASSTSKSLVDDIQSAIAPFAREPEE